MKKAAHIAAGFLFILSMVHWVQLLIELHAIEAWTDREMIRFGAGFLWQLVVIIGTVPSIIALGSGILSRVLPSTAPLEIQRSSLGEWGAVAAVLVLYLGISLLPYHPSSWFGYYVFGTVTLLLPVGIVGFVCRLTRQVSWAPGLSLSATWSGFFLAVLALVATGILISLIPVVEERALEQMHGRIGVATLAHYPILVFWSLLAGVAEELIFRGFLLTRIFRLTGSVSIAFLTSSLFFGLFHLYAGWHYAVVTGVYGLCFGVVTLWRRNLFPAVLAHVWINLIATAGIGARMAGYPGLLEQ